MSFINTNANLPVQDLRKKADGSWDLNHFTGGTLENITVPAVADSDGFFAIQLKEIPAKLNTSSGNTPPLISGLTAVDYTAPLTGQFFVDYYRGVLIFNSAQSSGNYDVDYWGKGSIIKSAEINSIKTDLDGFPDELKNLSQLEIQQIENIDATTISITQWGYLGELNQALTNVSDVAFKDLTLSGDLTVNGTITTINSTTLEVADKNIEMGAVTTPTDTTADGGGITLKGSTDKIIIWDNANNNWTSNQNFNISTGLDYKINNVSINTGGTLNNVTYLDQSNDFTGTVQSISTGSTAIFRIWNNDETTVSCLLAYLDGVGGTLRLKDDSDIMQVKFSAYEDNFLLQNLGIGTITPLNKLHINGTNDGTSELLIRLQSGGTSLNTDTGIGWYEASTLVGCIRLIDEGSSTRMAFDTFNNSNVLNIKGSNVGIGTIIPKGILDISAIGTSRLYVSSYGGNPIFQGYRANGTEVLPTAVVSDNIITDFLASGFDGTGEVSPARIRFKATENWNDTAHGTMLELYTTNTGENASQLSLTIKDGNVGIGTTAIDDRLAILYAPENDNGASGISTSFAPISTLTGTYKNNGMLINAYKNVSVGITDSGDLQGLRLFSLCQSDGNLEGLYGIYAGVGKTSGTGTITDSHGIHIVTRYKTGTTTNLHALHIEDAVTGGTVTNPFAIYSDWDVPSYFKGKIGIGTLTPKGTLDVSTIGASRLYVSSYGGNPIFQGYRSNGTEVSPTKVVSGNIITDFLASGFDGTDEATSARIRFKATEDWTDTAHGTEIELFTTTIGESASSVSMVIESDGHIRKTGTFAEIYVQGASTSQSIPTGVTYTKLTAFTTNGQSSNCTADVTNDKITITKTGKYKVTLVWNGESVTSNTIFWGTVFLNGVEQDQIHWKRKFGIGGDVGSCGANGFIDVTTAGWDLDVRVRHNDGGSEDLTTEYANLTVTYLGET